MRGNIISLLVLVLMLLGGAWSTALGQVPACINYQGRIIRNGTNFTGIAQFKFKLINADGSQSVWSSDGVVNDGREPAGSVPIPVNKGLFYARMGDTNIAGMALMSPSIFTNTDLRLRIWVDSGSGSELITPDQVLASVGYSMMSANIADGVVTPKKLDSATRELFVPKAGGAMSGALTNSYGFYGVGGVITNVVLNVAVNQFSVGANQLVAVSNRVGIGTAKPTAALEVVGNEGGSNLIFKVCAGTNVIAWARKKN